MKLKLILIRICLVVILGVLLSQFILAKSVSYIVEYDIETYNAQPRNCSVEFIHRENNQTMQGNCSYCRCSANLSNINAREGDIVDTNVCMYNKSFCRENGIKVRRGIEKIRFSINPCVPRYDVFFELTAFERKNNNKKSSSQEILNLKEDDKLKLDRLTIVKRNNCSLEDWMINFKITKPNDKTGYPFGIMDVHLPHLKENDKYIIEVNGGYYKIGGDYTSYILNYTTYINETKVGSLEFVGFQNLFYIGVWSIKGWLLKERYNSYDEDRLYTVYTYFKYDDVLNPSVFKVKEKSKHIELEETKNIKNLTVVLLLLAIVMTIPAFKEIDEIFKKVKSTKNKTLNYIWYFWFVISAILFLSYGFYGGIGLVIVGTIFLIMFTRLKLNFK